MKTLVKLLKICGVIIILLVAAVGIFIGYEHYEKVQKEEKELSYETTKKWDWHNKYNEVQISTTNNKSFLRKVNLDKKYIIYAYKNDDYSLSAMVRFSESCEPSTKIITSKKFSNGDPKILNCNEDGDALTFSAKWSGKGNDYTWEDELDGFSFKEKFSYWDFTKLDREITLSKSE